MQDIELILNDYYKDMCRKAHIHLQPYYNEFYTPETVSKDNVWVPNLAQLNNMIPQDIVDDIILGGLRHSEYKEGSFETYYWDDNSTQWKYFITSIEFIFLLVFMLYVENKYWDDINQEWILIQ